MSIGEERALSEQQYFDACRKIIVEQLGGKVDVQAWGEDRIRLTWVRRGETRLRTRAFREGDSLKIIVDRAGCRGWSAGRQVDVELRVPRSADLEVETGGPGPVTVSGIRGSIRLATGQGDICVRETAGSLSVETGSGNVLAESCQGALELATGLGTVTLKGARGNFNLETGSGSLTLADLAGNLEAEAGSGRIRISRIRGDLKLDSGSGDVILEGVASRRLEIETGSGDVSVDGYPLPDARWEVATGSGDVRLAIPATSDCRLNVETGSGRIDCRLPLRTREEGPGCLQGVLNRADAAVEVLTGSGNVVLEARPDSVPVPERETEPDEASLSVLRMVEEGKITPGEAEALLRALAGAPDPAPPREDSAEADRKAAASEQEATPEGT
ncbi:MAG TPA: DUF4097 family beta strand repeat-containing protein [Bacillota bacterium]|nr:DUF4097 family beta strand repeat-containing protein [Bacillota bacterium]